MLDAYKFLQHLHLLQHIILLSRSTRNCAILKAFHAVFDLSHVCVAASLVYKSKSVTVADGRACLGDPTLEIAVLIGALLYEHPYSSQSPALRGCFPLQSDQGSTSKPSDTHPLACNSHPSQHCKVSTEEQQSGQHEDPAEISASLLDQQSSSASGDPHPHGDTDPPDGLPGSPSPDGPQPSGGPHPPGDPHPDVDPNSPQATTAQSGQQYDGRPSNEASGPVSPRQRPLSTQAGFSETPVLCADPLCATPSQFVWADIETVALRALVTLHWAITGSTLVMEMLAKVVHALLLHHIMDRKLDMSNVLKFGLTAVLAALLYTESHPAGVDKVTATCLRHLAYLFLRRVATDRHAFRALYGRRTHVLEDVSSTGRVQNDLAIKALWSLLRKTSSVLHYRH